MKFVLDKKPKGATIIQGFPSMGLVSTITTKFLIDHLDVEDIGHIEYEFAAPLTAIHKSQIVNPITFYYSKKYNLIIIQALTDVTGHEWEIAETIVEISKIIAAKEVIVLESMPTQQENIELYYYSNGKSKLKLKPVTESIVIGTTAALLLKAKNLLVTCIFAEAHSQFPDSESAAKVVGALGNYLNIKMDIKPLIEAAKKFETSLKQYMEKTKQLKANIPKDKDDVNYFG